MGFGATTTSASQVPSQCCLSESVLLFGGNGTSHKTCLQIKSPQTYFKTQNSFQKIKPKIHTSLFCKYSWVPTRTPLIVPSTYTPVDVSNFTALSIDISQHDQTVFRTDLEDRHELGRLKDNSSPSQSLKASLPRHGLCR